MARYAVLRREAAHATTRPAVGVQGSRGGISSAGRLALEVEDLTGKSLPELLRDPAVEAAAPLMPTTLIRPFSGSGLLPGLNWGIATVGAERSRQSGAGVRIAVLDTGIDAVHAAFAGVNVAQKDFTGTGDGDANGHGTHCAGTIFGRDQGTQRIGVARGVTDVLVGKVLDDHGRGNSQMVFDAMLWASREHANIISMSLGFDFPGMVQELVDDGWPADLATSNALETYRGNLRMFDAIMQMLKAQEPFGGTPLVIAAAGNESRREKHARYRIAASLPAAASDVLSVAAIGRAATGNFEVAPFSNSMADVCAPGVNIESASAGGGTKSLSGTSMACPHVTGVAALWWQALRNSGLRPSASLVRSKLLATVRRDGFHGAYQEDDLGAGLVSSPD